MLNFTMVPWDYCGVTNYIYTAGKRRRDPEVTERNKFVYFLTRSAR